MSAPTHRQKAEGRLAVIHEYRQGSAPGWEELQLAWATVHALLAVHDELRELREALGR